jgi:hypothetical protein
MVNRRAREIREVGMEINAFSFCFPFSFSYLFFVYLKDNFIGQYYMFHYS